MYFPSSTPLPISAVATLKAHLIAVDVVVAAAASAILNRWLAKKAERRNPPAGRFITLTEFGFTTLSGEQGRRWFYCMESSGLIDLAAKKYRLIVFDRPGFGHSDRPRSTVWAPEAQADLIAAALQEISAPRAIVLGHSWGNVGGCCSCAEISARGPGLDFSLGLLLPERPS